MTKVGFFDSGHGGLGVLRASLAIMQSVDFYYIGDTAFHPYGEKSDDEVLERSLVLTKELMNVGCDVIVIACNSATAVAIDQLREKFPQVLFVGIEPYLNILTKKEFLKDDKIGVLVTERTFHSLRLKKLKQRVDLSNRLEIEFVKDLASFVEKLIMTKKQMDYAKLKAILAPVLNKKWNYLILGCTHYPLIIKELEDMFKAKCLDPAPYVAKQIKEVLSSKNMNIDKMTECDNSSDIVFNYMETGQGDWLKKKVKDFLWWNS